MPRREVLVNQFGGEHMCCLMVDRSSAPPDEHLLNLDTQLALLPARSREELLHTIEQIIATARRFDWTTAGQLLAQHRPLLSTLTGVQNLTAVHTDHLALHRYRNAMLALLMAACLSIGSHPDHVTTDFVRLRGSNQHTTRPYRDDEILLLNLLALGMSTHGDARAQRSAATYAQVATGLVPGETTTVTIADVDIDDPAAAHIEAPGNKTLKDRILDVDPLPAHLMATHQANLGSAPGSRWFTYMPNKDHTDKTPAEAYAGRCTSASRLLDHMRATVGLKFGDVTASSISLWRIETVYLTQGIAATLHVSGYNRIEKVLDLLGRGATARPETTRKTDVTSFDITT